jgi:hypothetical protein
MSFRFFGIPFGWRLQMANMSAIYEYLGARAAQIPILWLAAPLTGLIVQPSSVMPATTPGDASGASAPTSSPARCSVHSP